MKTNWEELSRKLGVLQPDGGELYTTINSAQSLEEILGDEWLKNTLDTFIDGTPGNELAIKTLRFIRTEKAAKMAFEIYQENKETDIQKARLAIWALSDIRMPICMDYVEEFIQNQDFESIAIGLLRNLVYENVIEYGQARLNRIFDNINPEFEEDIAPLREHVRKEFEANNC
jgi:hypothetical protein